MPDIVGFINFLTPQLMWAIGIVVAVSVPTILWYATQYRADYRELKKTFEPAPVVQAAINKKSYPGGWRSAQLHLFSANEHQLLKYENWHIEFARLLGPSNAVLARAKDDDYASEVFYPDAPVRELTGKISNLPQRYALEFFIKFSGDDRGQKAQFKVWFSHVNKTRGFTGKVWAVVPTNADAP